MCTCTGCSRIEGARTCAGNACSRPCPAGSCRCQCNRRSAYAKAGRCCDCRIGCVGNRYLHRIRTGAAAGDSIRNGMNACSCNSRIERAGGSAGNAGSAPAPATGCCRKIKSSSANADGSRLCDRRIRIRRNGDQCRIGIAAAPADGIGNRKCACSGCCRIKSTGSRICNTGSAPCTAAGGSAQAEGRRSNAHRRMTCDRSIRKRCNVYRNRVHRATGTAEGVCDHMCACSGCCRIKGTGNRIRNSGPAPDATAGGGSHIECRSTGTDGRWLRDRCIKR